MTVKELISLLNTMPPNGDLAVFVDDKIFAPISITCCEDDNDYPPLVAIDVMEH